MAKKTTRKAPLKAVPQQSDEAALSPEQQAQLQLEQFEQQLVGANASEYNTPIKALIAILGRIGVSASFDTMVNLDTKQIETVLSFKDAEGQDYRIDTQLLSSAAQQISMTSAVTANICSSVEEQLSQPKADLDEATRARIQTLGVHRILLVRQQVSDVAITKAENA